MKPRRAAAVAALAATLAQGCASTPPETRLQADLGAIAVVAGGDPPTFDLRSVRAFSDSKAKGAALGATLVFLQCNATLPPSCGSGATCGAVLAVWWGVCGAGMAAGAIAGAAASSSATALREPVPAMLGKLQVEAMQDALREQVAGALSARGKRPVEVPSADTLAVVWLSRIVLDGEHRLYMNATVRLVRRSDWAELSTTQYVHAGPKHTLEAWSENDGARLLAALEAGYESLGVRIHDGVFPGR